MGEQPALLGEKGGPSSNPRSCYGLALHLLQGPRVPLAEEQKKLSLSSVLWEGHGSGAGRARSECDSRRLRHLPGQASRRRAGSESRAQERAPESLRFCALLGSVRTNKSIAFSEPRFPVSETVTWGPLHL